MELMGPLEPSLLLGLSEYGITMYQYVKAWRYLPQPWMDIHKTLRLLSHRNSTFPLYLTLVGHVPHEQCPWKQCDI